MEEIVGYIGEVINFGDFEDDLGEDFEGVVSGVIDRFLIIIFLGKMVMKIMIRDMDFIIN